MTPEEKQLLLIDLCARLPYGVKVKLLCRGPEQKFDDWIEATLNTKDIELFGKSFKNIKPYLRPISSMTEEEAEKYNDLVNDLSEFDYPPEQSASRMIDWLIANHFDFRGLIPKGLALEAPKDMYKTE